jgi:hypothetical protein
LLSPLIAGAFFIGRSTAFTYKGKVVDLKQIGHDLNARYILEGSVQRAATACALTSDSSRHRLARTFGPSARRIPTRWTFFFRAWRWSTRAFGRLAYLAAANACAGHVKEAREAASQLQKVSPRFTVQKSAGSHWSDDPTCNAQQQRVTEGLRKAGLADGEQKTN